jgi:hypothetical protein
MATIRQLIKGPEAELRALWTAKGVPAAQQDAMIADTVAKAQPGAMVGPFQISGSLGLANPLARDQATLAQRRADAPLRPTVAQAPADHGLFSDVAAQSDLIDAVRKLDR